ncbi:PREDICTED: kinesin-like protein KIF18B, partial [Colobus angolensis palliatus]|uniref:kinesin-like protein KIF18B n=1 Tax=Colobus angolensis palliatus TaxID=336983 RepID=UPI0005F5173A
QPCTPELPAGPRALQEESLGTEAQVERAMEGNSSDQEQSPKDQGEGPAKEVPTQMPEQNPTHALPESPGLTLQPNPVVGHLSAQELERDRSKQYTGPVTRTMARRLSGPLHTLGIPSGPNCTPAQESRWPMEKKKRRRPSPLEPDSPMAPKRGTKRQRQSFLPCLRRGSLPDAQPSQGPSTPKGERASSPCHSPHFCPTTVIKSRVPLGPSAMQNCSTPLAPPTRDLNATFDLSEEPPSKPSFHECIGWDKIPQELSRLDQPFIPRGPMPLFTMKGPKPTSSLPGTSACQKKRIA